MKVISKIFYKTILCWIAICIFTLTIGQFLPLEITNDNFSSCLYILIWIALIIALFIFIFKRKKQKVTKFGKSTLIVFKIVITAIAIYALFLLGIFILFGGICGYSTKNTLFINKSYSSLKIVERSIECGAFDSDYPKYECYEIMPLTNFMMYAKKIDTLKIDKEKWIRIKK